MTAALPPEDDLPEQMRVRRHKLERLRAAGADPYPLGFPRSTTAATLRKRHAELPPDSATGEHVGVVGRVVASRIGGRLCFATIRDGSGDLQVMLSLDRLGPARLADWKADVDLGDHVGVEGEVISSKRGELSVLADRWAITSKALRPLPDKYHGLSDPEARVRQRYVDLIVRHDARRLVQVRASVLRSVRESFHSREYVEVETPTLQPLHGGASARPFVTRLNAFGVPMYLRIALELYLKRMLVGGIERVYEMGRIFRNEGVDSSHSPEFTMIEAYEAYGDYDTMAELTRMLVLEAASALGSSTVPDGRGGQLDLALPWKSASIHELVSEALGSAVTPDTSEGDLRALAAGRSVELASVWSAGQVVLELYEQLVEPGLREPTFVRDYPAEIHPLARPHRRDPRLVESWDLVILGRELATAFSELTDPIEQRRRLTNQSERFEGGMGEGMAVDEDFLRALEHGMPPAGGMGMGVDRLVMLLTGTASIRETIAFPLVKPQGSPQG